MFAFREILTKRFLRAITGEFVATLIFVLLALSSTKWAGEEETPESSTLLMISFCFGLSITTMVYCFGHISGAHINPAVTVAMVFSRKMNVDKAFFYLAAQCLGATAGTAILYVVTPKAAGGSFGATMLNADISLLQGIAVELLVTFQLVFTVFATCDPQNSQLQGCAALAIGLAVVIGHLFAVYWAGPIAGGVIAAIFYKYLCHPHLQFKECVLGENAPKLPPPAVEKQEEAESVHIPDTDKNPKGGWLGTLQAFLMEKMENAQPKPVSPVEEKPPEIKEAVYCPPDAERVEKKEPHDYPQYELNLKF